MPIRSLCAALLVVAAAMLAAPARAANDPPLVPLAAFFANPKAAWEHRVSPDGARLAWVAMHKGRASVHFRRLEETAARTVETPRELRPPWGGSPSFWWSREGRRLLFLADANGDALLYDIENFARRQPWLVAGAGAVAGFLAARFVKASSGTRYRSAGSQGYRATAPVPTAGGSSGIH